MTHFDNLIACIRSGQLSPQQIAEEMKDPKFAAHYRRLLGAGADPVPAAPVKIVGTGQFKIATDSCVLRVNGAQVAQGLDTLVAAGLIDNERKSLVLARQKPEE